MTSDIFCSTAVIATTFDAGSDPSLPTHLLADQELAKLQRRYRSQCAAVVVHAFERWLRRADCALPDPASRGVVLGSATGAGPDIEVFLDNSISVGDHLVNPALFPMTVHHAAAGIAAIATECRGPNVVVSAGLGSAWSALDAACALIHDRSAELVFVGGFESQPLAEGERGSLAAVVGLAPGPDVLGRSYLAPLSTMVNVGAHIGANPVPILSTGLAQDWEQDTMTERVESGAERSGKARVAALLDWAAAFAGGGA